MLLALAAFFRLWCATHPAEAPPAPSTVTRVDVIPVTPPDAGMEPDAASPLNDDPVGEPPPSTLGDASSKAPADLVDSGTTPPPVRTDAGVM